MNVFSFLRKHGIETVDSSFYRYVDAWESWYMSNVAKFHMYKVYIGAGRYIKRHRASLCMAKKVCEDIADLLMNEKVKFTFGSDSTYDFVKSVFVQNNMYTKLNRCQERKAAVGTVAYVPYLDNVLMAEDGSVLNADVRINCLSAKNIFPLSWSNGIVTECAFVFEKTHERKKYAHFQIHKREKTETGWQYVIENLVAECTSGSGRDMTREEWSKIPAFAGLVERIETGSDKPQFVIDTLNIANNYGDDETNPMGVSIFANSVDTLAKIDLEYDSYENEFSLGKKRLFVSPEMLSDHNGNMVFDPDDSVFYTLPEDYFNNSHEAIHEVNMALRVEEHQKAIDDDLHLLSLKCGLGGDYYKYEKGNITTATQVISEDSDLYRTIKKHEIVLDVALRDLIGIIIRLGISAGVKNLDENTSLSIDFDDSIIEDSATERNSDRQDVSMGAMSLAEYRAKWYGETIVQAQANLPEQSGGIME